MSRKSEIKKQMADIEREIEALENKRERSQSMLLNAFILKTEPDPDDVKYFRVFTSLIEERRALLRQLGAELKSLSKK